MVSIWTVQIEKATAFFGFDESQFFYMSFTGLLDRGSKKAKQAMELLLNGESIDPVIAQTGAKTRVAPLANIQSIAAKKHSDAIKITYLRPDNGKLDHFEFVLKDGKELENATVSLAAAVNRPSQVTRQEVSFLEAATAPGIVMVVVTILSLAVIATARDLAAGKAIEISGRRQGLKRLLVTIAETLGETNAYIVGGLLIAGSIGYLVMRIVKRPAQDVITFEAA